MNRVPKITVQKGKTQHRVVLKAANNRTVAVTETYKTKAGANNAASLLKKIASNAQIKKAK